MKRWYENISYEAPPPPSIPLHRLLAAILHRAILDALSTYGIERHIKREAIYFLHLHEKIPIKRKKRKMDEDTFTYFEITEALDLCPYLIHKELKGRLKDGKKGTHIRF